MVESAEEFATRDKADGEGERWDTLNNNNDMHIVRRLHTFSIAVCGLTATFTTTGDGGDAVVSVASIFVFLSFSLLVHFFAPPQFVIATHTHHDHI